MPEEQSGAEKGGLDLVGRTIVDRYRVDALLGEGAMGAVYRGTQLGLERPVAIKVLHPRHTGEPTVAKRFDREAVAISKLDHRNCVQVLDAGTTEDRLKYIVMEHLSGQELRAVLTGPLGVERAVDLALQILAGLEHAHRRGLVHRDLKPENIFVVTDDDGAEVVKIVDFGIVKLLDPADEKETLSRIGMVFGTPAYMAPEQAAGGKVDARTDLYGAGILLYEMLAGDPPFKADQPGLLLRMHMLHDPPPLPDEVPEAVRAVVAKLLAKTAADRYETAREAREALQAAVSDPPAPSRGGLVFLPPPVKEVESPPVPAPADKPRRDTWRGSAPLGEGAPEAPQPPKRTSTIRVDLGAVHGTAPHGSTTDLAGILAKPAPRMPNLPIGPSESSGASPAPAPAPRPPAERSGTMRVAAAIDPTTGAGVQVPTSGGFGTARAAVPGVAAPPPRKSFTGKVILLLAILAIAIAGVLYGTGAFARHSAAHGGSGDG